MNNEQLKAIQNILSQLVLACQCEMGTDWCTEMLNRINELQNIGKP